MKKFEYSRFCPPGYDYKYEKTVLFCASIFSICWSLVFYVRYFIGLRELYSYRGGKRELIKGRMMPQFYELAGGAFIGFSAVFFVLLCFIVLRYAYYYRGSKSIYTMKRLPQKYELSVSCLVLPIIFMLLCVLVIFAVLLFDLAFYLIFTPKQCLYPFSLDSLWRALI